jgi:hypothetical protein
MSARVLALLALFMLFTGTVRAADKVLSKTYPDVKWVETAIEQADLAGDGLVDIFAMGLDQKGNVVVAIRYGSNSATQKLVFPSDDLACSPANYGTGCDVSVPKLSKFRIEEKTPSDLAATFDLESTDIFVKNGRAEVVVVPVGETDPFYFYWNAKNQRLEWLRL